MTSDEISAYYKNLPKVQLAFIQAFYESETQKIINIDGVSWHYYDSQTDGPVLMLLHGGFADFTMWIHQIMAFRSDFRVIAPTCPGLRKATMSVYSNALTAIIKKEKIRHLNLLGYSEGGLIAQCFLREQQALIDKVVLGHTFFPSTENKYYQHNFNLFRRLPAPVTTWLFKKFAQPDKEELEAKTVWQDWFRAYFKDLKSNLTKPIIITHIDLMMDFVRNYHFHPDDLTSWYGKMLITVASDDIVYKYFEGMKTLYPFAETHVFDEGLGAHSIALISPEFFNRRIREFMEA